MKHTHLRDDFSMVDMAYLSDQKGWQAQYKTMIAYGRCISSKPWLRTEENKLAGCELPTWLNVACVEQKYWYDFDSDSRVINGLVALILAPLQGRPREFVTAEAIMQPLITLGIDRHITPSRNNGLVAISRAIEQATREPFDVARDI